MENKLNIAELLKDCPSGMELDSTIVGGLYFDEVTENNMIKCYTKRYYEPTSTCNSIYFYSDGSYINHTKAKCVIFPKGKTTWEGFQKPFKDGDVIYNQGIKAVAIFNKQTDNVTISHCYLNIWGKLLIHHSHCKNLSDWRLATKEEKQKLFDAIKANGYKWNPETKTLKKLEVNKFDITTLKPFESRVLVRSGDNSLWKPAIFGCYVKDAGFFALGGTCWMYCIPFKENEHLLSTTDDCEDFYKTWE